MASDDFDFDAAYASAPTGNWRDGLSKTEDGAIRKNLFNACVALRDHPELTGKIAYNEFSGCAWVRDPLPWDNRTSRPWSEFDDLKATEWLQSPNIRIMVGSGTAREAAQSVAYEARFHPVLDWLESLKWDGTKRLDAWLTTYLGVPASPLAAAIGRKFLISAVARIQKPGCKVDHVLILEGQQGALKSKTLRALVGEDWFADQIADLGTKDSCQDLRGVWIVELSELSAIRPSEVEKVKAYVSRQVDHYRPSYGRRSIDVPRQTVFIGTTNAGEYLTDSTGNRRYWPVTTTKLDVEAIARDRAQLWAEAVAAYHAGETWWLDDAELRDAVQQEQEERRIEDPWESIVADWLDDPTRVGHDGARYPIALEGRVTNAMILEHAICKPTERQTTADQMRVGRILKRLGWQKRKRGKANRIEWEVSRPDPEPEEPIGPECDQKGVSPGEVSRRGVSPETHGNSQGQRGETPRDTFSLVRTQGNGGQDADSGVRGVSPGTVDGDDEPDVEADPIARAEATELPDDDEHARWLRGEL